MLLVIELCCRKIEQVSSSTKVADPPSLLEQYDANPAIAFLHRTVAAYLPLGGTIRDTPCKLQLWINSYISPHH